MHLTLYKYITIVILILFLCGLSLYYRQKMIYFRKVSKKKKLEIGRLRKSINLYKNLSKLDDFDENTIKDIEHLNERQKEVAMLMIQGYTNIEMAEKLFIAPTTIKYHIRNIFKICGVKNRSQLYEKISDENIKGLDAV